MANYHFRTKVSTGQKSKAHAQYILAENKYAYKNDEVVYVSNHTPEDIPVSTFWEACDIYERANGRQYREFEFSLPSELPLEENINIVDDFIEKTLGNRFFYTAVIHNKEASQKQGQQNMHCHLMFNERELDEFNRPPQLHFKRCNVKNPSMGGAKKSIEFNHKDKLIELRKDFEDLVNSYYEKNGLDMRVSCETLVKQKEIAEQSNDETKAEYLDRKPIDIPGYILMKKIEQMSEYEKELFIEYELNRDVKDEKEKAYLVEKERLNLVAKKEEQLQEIEMSPATIFNKYIENEKTILKPNEELIFIKTKIEMADVFTLIELEKDNKNLMKNKNNLENELKVLDAYGLLSEETIIYRKELETKIINLDKMITINLENVKLNRKDEYDMVYERKMNDFKDREYSINIYILEFKEENMKLINNSSEPIMLTPESFNNALTLEKYLKLNKNFATLTNSISGTESQLEPKKLADTTYNHLSNGEYARLSNQISLIQSSISEKNRKISTGKVSKEADVKKMRDEISKLEKECRPFEAELEKLKDAHKSNFESTKNDKEIKLKSKLINYEEKKPILQESLAGMKSNFIKNSSLDTLFREKKDSLNRDKGIHEHNSEYYIWVKEKINEKFTNGKIVGRAKNMMTKGQYYLVTKGYKRYKRELDNIEVKLKNTSFTNIIEKVKLNKEKGILNDKVKAFSDQLDQMNEMFRSKPKELKVYMDKIIDLKIEILKTYNIKYITTKQKEFEVKTELSAINNLEKTLTHNTTLQTMRNVAITNPFVVCQENITSRGGSASILDQEDEILKENKKRKGMEH